MILRHVRVLVEEERTKDEWSSPTVLPRIVPFQATIGSNGATYMQLPEKLDPAQKVYAFVCLLDDNLNRFRTAFKKFQDHLVKERVSETPENFQSLVILFCSPNLRTMLSPIRQHLAFFVHLRLLDIARMTWSYATSSEEILFTHKSVKSNPSVALKNKLSTKHKETTISMLLIASSHTREIPIYVPLSSSKWPLWTEQPSGSTILKTSFRQFISKISAEWLRGATSWFTMSSKQLPRFAAWKKLLITIV